MSRSTVDIMYNMETELLQTINNLLLQGEYELAEWKLIKLKELGHFNELSYEIIKKNIGEAISIANASIIEKGKEACKEIYEIQKKALKEALK